MKAPTAAAKATVIGVLLLAATLTGCCAVYGTPVTSYKPRYGPFLPFVVPTPTPRPTASPRPTERPTPRPTKKPVQRPRAAIDGPVVGGVATWYCNKDARRGPLSRCSAGHPGGLYAAVRKDMLWMRGKRITVCARRCVQVTVIDCNCGKNANLIDLYADAFERIAPLSKGSVRVEVR